MTLSDGEFFKMGNRLWELAVWPSPRREGVGLKRMKRSEPMKCRIFVMARAGNASSSRSKDREGFNKTLAEPYGLGWYSTGNRVHLDNEKIILGTI